MSDIPYKIHKLYTEVSVTGLINVSYYTFSRDFLWSGESHNFWEMVYVDKGSLIITAGKDTYLLKSGEAAFHCPNEFHNLRSDEQTSTHAIVISFLCTSPMMSALERKILPLSPREKQCLSSIIQEAEQTYMHFDNIPPQVDLVQLENSPFGSQQIIKNLLEYFLILIYRHGDAIRFDARAVPVNQMHHNTQLALQVLAYLNEHYQDKITLELLASTQNISISQLKRVFKEHTGQSVIAYLTARRIREAKKLVQKSGLNFSQIATAVGYDNIYYFSSVFKKQTGMTLTEYAKSLRQ